MLTELRMPTMKRLWEQIAEQSNREGWPAERFLSVLLGQREDGVRRLTLAVGSSRFSTYSQLLGKIRKDRVPHSS